MLLPSYEASQAKTYTLDEIDVIFKNSLEWIYEHSDHMQDYIHTLFKIGMDEGDIEAELIHEFGIEDADDRHRLMWEGMYFYDEFL